jgi:hypothetical protein
MPFEPLKRRDFVTLLARQRLELEDGMLPEMQANPADVLKVQI